MYQVDQLPSSFNSNIYIVVYWSIFSTTLKSPCLTVKIQHGHQTHQDHVCWRPLPHQWEESLQRFNSTYHLFSILASVSKHQWNEDELPLSLCCFRRWLNFTSRTPWRSILGRWTLRCKRLTSSRRRATRLTTRQTPRQVRHFTQLHYYLYLRKKNIISSGKNLSLILWACKNSFYLI